MVVLGEEGVGGRPEEGWNDRRGRVSEERERGCVEMCVERVYNDCDFAAKPRNSESAFLK